MTSLVGGSKISVTQPSAYTSFLEALEPFCNVQREGLRWTFLLRSGIVSVCPCSKHRVELIIGLPECLASLSHFVCGLGQLIAQDAGKTFKCCRLQIKV